MAEEFQVHVIGWRVSLDDTVDFLGLPVDNAGDNEGQTTTGIPLLEPIAAVEFPSMPIFTPLSRSESLGTWVVRWRFSEDDSALLRIS